MTSENEELEEVNYDREQHIKLLDKVLYAGKLPIHFCEEANISEQTFQDWLGNC